MNKINTFDYLKDFKRIHVKIIDSLFYKIKNIILNEYGSLSKYNKKFSISNYVTLQSEFKTNIYHPFYRLLKIIETLNISKEELYFNITCFYNWGSHSNCEVKIPQELNIDQFFVEGYSLYLAEGDTGFSGTKKPDGFRFTNADPNVINHMIKWLETYFPKNKFYVIAINPKGNPIDFDKIKTLINCDKIFFKEDSYNKIVKYRIILDRVVLIDLILSIEDTIKELCAKDPKLAAAYIRGMMIGEGTAYFNRSRYVRIEMRNEREIKYLHSLLTMLEFDCKPVLRSNRHNMWSLYIGAKQLTKFAKEIGFGVHQGRQQILDKGVNKVLRINQYC